MTNLDDTSIIISKAGDTITHWGGLYAKRLSSGYCFEPKPDSIPPKLPWFVGSICLELDSRNETPTAL